MRVSLRTSVILFVAAINVAAFGSGLAWITDRFADERQQDAVEYGELLGAMLEERLDTKGNVKAAGILRWRRWDVFEDAIIVHLPELERGRLDPDWGVRLNPIGSGHRPQSFDSARVLSDVVKAAESGEGLSTGRGVSLPVYLPNGRLWGGCWVVPKLRRDVRDVVMTLLPWFLVSMLATTLVTFTAMRHLVLDPVRVLARAAGNVSAGDLSTRIPEPTRSDELSDLVRAFNAMTLKVEEYNATLAERVEVATAQAREAEVAAMTQRRLAATGELAAGIAHEINNPLGGMQNALEVIAREGTSQKRRDEYIELLRNGLGRIERTVGRVLRLAPRSSTTGGTVRVHEPLADAIGLARHRAEKAGVRVFLRLGDAEHDAFAEGALESLTGLPPVVGEGHELGQAFLNLFVNAIDAIESVGAEGDPDARWAPDSVSLGRIDVVLSVEASELLIQFADNGPGMAPDLVDRAADPFFTTKQAGMGTGLGLAFVYHVVAACGGRVVLRSPADSGFRVELHLPLAGGATEGGGEA